MKLIDKDALVAEIERRQKIHFNDYHINGNNSPADYGACNALTQLLSFIDSLEVKEVDLEKRQEEDVDLEKEVNQYYEKTWPFEEVDEDIIAFARHFFELGLKAQSKDMIEALRTEYEKGRADVIADTLSWLANVWPQYCSNPNIIKAFEENVIKD